jgi:YfiR/HmsC-like
MQLPDLNGGSLRLIRVIPDQPQVGGNVTMLMELELDEFMHCRAVCAGSYPVTPRPHRAPAVSRALILCFGARAALALCLCTPLAQAATTTTESQVEAVFVYNFSRFVEWPPQAFATADGPFVIGILGSDPFGGRLDEAVHGEQINGHALEIRRFHNVSEIGNCQILFIDRSQGGDIKNILNTLDHRSILTVSALEDSTKYGVMVQFATENNRVRLRINVDSAKAAGLTISSKLLRPAEIVTSGISGGAT